MHEDATTWVALINGGASAPRNYFSHVEHVRQFLDVLDARDIDRSQIAVFASDGIDPTPDVAILDSEAVPGEWLIEGHGVDRPLRSEIHLQDVQIDEVRRYPGTSSAFSEWLAEIDAEMSDGDTLVVYVTDHGWENRENRANNAISMWHERMYVDDLRRRVDLLPDGVRVVMLMSQCYSGGFGAVGYSTHSIFSDPDRNVCGYFSSTADRPAYGCYPENVGKRNIGHSFRFIEALRRSPDFVSAHEQVLLTDQTPDVPLRTSDQYLHRLLLRGARASGQSLEEFSDRLLAQAWADEMHYRSLVEQIDAIGRTYGSSSPRSIRHLDQEAHNFPELRSELLNYAGKWEAASRAFRRERFRGFLTASPHWQEPTQPESIESLDPGERAELRSWLVTDFREHAFSDVSVKRRLKLLRDMALQARAAAYRMDIRRAASERMRWLLLRIAGLVYVDRFASHDERAAFERVTSCEDFSLPADRSLPLGRVPIAETFPPLDVELAILAAVVPGWFGLETRPLSSAAQAAVTGARGGSVRVVEVTSGSPAERAGVVPDDIIVGPPDAHFVDPTDFLEWALTSIVDEPTILDVYREGSLLRVEIVPGAPPA